MRVQLVDPSSYTRPYDHALGEALAQAGVEVELVTSPFHYGEAPEPRGYRVREAFYRRASRHGPGSPWIRRATKLVEHLPDMARYRRISREADVSHYQWLVAEPLDMLLLPDRGPRVMTMHNVIRRGQDRLRQRLTRRLAQRMDAVVVHSRESARHLREVLRVDPERVHVIHPMAFEHLVRQPDERPLPPELADPRGPVILFLGRIRPYKGADVLLRAFRELRDAELWIVGMPLATRMEPLHRLAEEAQGTVRFLTRFVPDSELPAIFRRADVVVLPYRRVDQSGVLQTALAFGKPLVLSAVGGFIEVAQEDGAALLVPPGDERALAAVLRELLDDPVERERLAAAAEAAARGPYSWRSVGQRTAELYRQLLEAPR